MVQSLRESLEDHGSHRGYFVSQGMFDNVCLKIFLIVTLGVEGLLASRG